MHQFTLQNFFFSPIEVGEKTIQRISLFSMDGLEKAAGISGGNLSRSLRSENGLNPESYAEKVKFVLEMLGFKIKGELLTGFQKFQQETFRMALNPKHHLRTNKRLTFFMVKFTNHEAVKDFKEAKTIDEFKPIINQLAALYKLSKLHKSYAIDIITEAFNKFSEQQTF